MIHPPSSPIKLLLGRLSLAVAGLVWLTGCASIGPPLPASLELPKAPSDLRPTRKGDRVTLTWTIPAHTTDRQRVRYLGKTRVCRSIDQTAKECGKPIGDVEPPPDFAALNKSSTKKLKATFADTLSSAIEQSNATGSAIYAVEVLNSAGRGAGISNQVRVALVPTVPPFTGFTATPGAQGVLISWQCPPASARRTDIKYLFRISRRPESSESVSRIAEIDATECVQSSGEQDKIVTSFLDQTFEWEKTYFYRGAVVSVVEAAAGKPAVEVEGDDTAEVKVFAHDVFPPAVPSGLQAVFSGPGQQLFIDLIWAPVAGSDLDGYNVYRHEQGGTVLKVNSEPVKMPAFRDALVVAGKNYFYSVSAVDLRGNESARSEEASESVP
jgi:hypothetical protein